MKPNTKKINELVKQKYNGNISAFARSLGLDRAHLTKIINTGTCAGSKFYGAFLNYCEKEGLDFKEYIFLNKSVKKINKSIS